MRLEQTGLIYWVYRRVVGYGNQLTLLSFDEFDCADWPKSQLPSSVRDSKSSYTKPAQALPPVMKFRYNIIYNNTA